MDDQSLWKKELSFRRKPKGKKDGDDASAVDEKPTSMWKKELSFKRKSKADAVQSDVAADPAADEPAVAEPVAKEPSAVEPEVAQETVWKKEISFGINARSDDEPIEAEPLVAEATAAVVSESEPEPERSSEEKVWKKEVSFSRKPSLSPRSPRTKTRLKKRSGLQTNRLLRKSLRPRRGSSPRRPCGRRRS